MNTSWVDFLADIVYPALAAEAIYTHPAHQWQSQNPEKWRGACPWHESRSGSSFTVTPATLLWWCQGCGRGGAPMQYLWRLHGGAGLTPRGRDFVALVRELAALAGVPFPAPQFSPADHARFRAWEVRRAILGQVMRQAQCVLWSSSGDVARAYLTHERGFSETALRDLGFGLYPPISELRTALRAHGYAADDLRDTGVLWKKLAGYVVVPWQDDAGRPLTLYGRWPGIPPAGRPKTIALPGEASKRSPLYLDRALAAGHAEVVLVEGVLDAALAHALGDTRVVACVAAQLSRRQAEALAKRKIHAVTVCLDPDSGGENGTTSCIKTLRAQGIRAYIAPKLPDGLDPDEFLIQRGMAAWQAHLDQAVAAVRWQAERLLAPFDVATEQGRDAAVTALLAYGKTLADPVEQDNLSRLLAEQLGYTGSLSPIGRRSWQASVLRDPWLGPRSQWHGVPTAVRRVQA